MKSVRRIVACMLGIFVVNFNAALAQGQGHGRGKERHGDDWTRKERSVGPRTGKAACAARRAPTGTAEVHSTVPGGT